MFRCRLDYQQMINKRVKFAKKPDLPVAIDLREPLKSLAALRYFRLANFDAAMLTLLKAIRFHTLLDRADAALSRARPNWP